MNFFYSRTERRLRAFWRILIQLIAQVLAMSLVSILSALVMFSIFGLLGLAQWDAFTDPNQFFNAINQFLSQQPYARAFFQLGMVALWFPFYLLLAKVLDRRPWRSYGLQFNRVWWMDMSFGLLLGGILMALIFVAEVLLGWVTISGPYFLDNPGVAFWPALLAGFAHYVWVGVNEEMFSRGYQLRNLAEGLNSRRINPRWALLISYLVTSSIFGLLHLGNDHSSLMSSLNLILAGLLLGLGLLLTGNLAIPIGLHITWNFFQGNVFGFPVSGFASQVSLIGIQQAGPELWTGGAFGPEAGLIGVLAMLLGLALTWLYVRWTRGSVRLYTELAVYTVQPEALAGEAPAGQPARVGSPEPGGEAAI